MTTNEQTKQPYVWQSVELFDAPDQAGGRRLKQPWGTRALDSVHIEATAQLAGDWAKDGPNPIRKVQVDLSANGELTLYVFDEYEVPVNPQRPMSEGSRTHHEDILIIALPKPM